MSSTSFNPYSTEGFYVVGYADGERLSVETAPAGAYIGGSSSFPLLLVPIEAAPAYVATLGETMYQPYTAEESSAHTRQMLGSLARYL